VISEHHRPAGISDLSDNGGQRAVRRGVQSRPRFVEHQQLRRYQQRLRQRDLLRISLGQGPQRGVLPTHQRQTIQKLIRPRSGRARTQTRIRE
jgi:hypothetical protein